MGRQRALLPDPAGLCGLVVFLVLSLFSGAKVLRDGDTLWHIRFGALMLEHGELITHDSFSHTAYGQPWLAHEWLSEIIMAALYSWAGLPGVALFYFAIVGLTFTLLFKIASRLVGDGSALAAVAIALPFAMTHLLARPHLFTWLGAALTLFILSNDNDRAHWLLVPLTALWANLHGGVLFGLVLQAIFIAGRLIDSCPGRSRVAWLTWWQSAKIPIAVFLSSTLAVGINPFGFELLLFPLLVSNKIFAAEIGEWQSPDFRLMWYLRLWIIALFLTAACRNNLYPWAWRLLAIFLFWEALGHVRHVSMAIVLLVPVAAISIKSLGWRRSGPLNSIKPEEVQLVLSSWSGPLLTTVCCAALILLFTLAPTQWRSRAERRFPLPKEYSQGAIDYLLKEGFPGRRLFNHYEWGDYLLFAFKEPPPLFIDGRADMYGERIFSDYVKMIHLAPQTDEMLSRYGIDWVLFPANHLFARTLQLDAAWKIRYRDDHAVILSKTVKQ